MPNVLEAEGCEPGSHDGLQTQLGVAPAQFFELSALPITLSASQASGFRPFATLKHEGHEMY